MALIGIFLAKLFSPFIVMIGVASGWYSKHWWHILVASLIAASVNEFLLGMTQYTRNFNAVVFIIGMLAAALWAGIALLIRKRRSQ